MNHLSNNASGHIDDFSRHLIVLLIRLGYGNNSIARVVECRPVLVKRARKNIKESIGVYAQICVKMDPQGTRHWYNELTTIAPFIKAKLDKLHPSAELYRSQHRERLYHD